jgi:pyruvate,orthophosphate dikinase
VDIKAQKFTAGKHTVKAGDYITIDGGTGRVMLGKVQTKDPEVSGDFGTLMQWADEARTMGVRANADIPRDAVMARRFGAEGIGLCRTEHMFFAEERLPIVQQMILADTIEARENALAKLLPMQRSDFKGLFESMDGFPVTIRLLDPPLHEFLPKREELMVEIAVMKAKRASKATLSKKEKLLRRVEELHEFNPMLGLRGCRLGIVYPEITRMQTRAIIEAACDLAKKGTKVVPEIMVPLVGLKKELQNQKELIKATAEEVMSKKGCRVEYLVGTMIELPRAALVADEIAREAEFFSFGTNDLTQTTFGFSRDDAGRFINYYTENNILDKDPFQTLDQDGVGQLVQIGVTKGRSTRQNLKVGICGEHGGDPASVEFCYRTGLNYVSCSPYRVPIARLAAAHARLKEKGVEGSVSK